jgi:hypothetical protein
VVGEFIGVPAEPNAQADSSTGEMIERRDGFRQSDRIVFDRQRHRGGQPHPRGDRAGRPQAYPRIQRAHVAVVRQRFVAGGRMGRFALDRDMGVLGHVERLKPVVIGESGSRRRGDSAIAGEQHKPEVHG